MEISPPMSVYCIDLCYLYVCLAFSFLWDPTTNFSSRTFYSVNLMKTFCLSDRKTALILSLERERERNKELYSTFENTEYSKFTMKILLQGRFRYQPGQVRAFGMLAGGSGITPMYQVHNSFSFGLLILVPQPTIIWIT